ncbi:hypothetical protein G6F40_018139 [Rhizopus arrhizus]|nr:hypothetical protein G6F40_018139 [Rhizopus arrhizus]
MGLEIRSQMNGFDRRQIEINDMHVVLDLAREVESPDQTPLTFIAPMRRFGGENLDDRVRVRAPANLVFSVIDLDQIRVGGSAR